MRKRLVMLGTSALTLSLWSLPVQAADPPGDLPGPIDSLSDLQDSGKMLFKIADQNNDGQISQREAIDAGNLIVGGFFFRADANGDGTLSKEEFGQARDAFLAQRPVLKAIIDRVQRPDATTGEKTANPKLAQGILAIVDTNGDGQVQSAELRQLVQTGVQSLFATADTNRDGQLNPSEVNAATVGAGRAVAQTLFDTADTDHNGQLSQAEYDKALTLPAHIVFKALDANNDGQLSPQEAQMAQQIMMSQLRMLRVPEAPNSVRNLIQSGAKPEQVTPIPNFRNAPPVRNTPPQNAPQQVVPPQ